ncbi:MAG: hypothetical protein IKV83_09070 [Muribaculaceae bacterium]|nr:hypothetical protein [Muribaculaceae bacterium]
MEKASPLQKDQKGPTLRGLYSINLQNKYEILFLIESFLDRLTEGT